MKRPQETDDIEWLVGVLKNIQWACEQGIELDCGDRDRDQVAQRCEAMVETLMRQYRRSNLGVIDSRQAGRKVAHYVADDVNDQQAVVDALNPSFFEELFSSELNKQATRRPHHVSTTA